MAVLENCTVYAWYWFGLVHMWCLYICSAEVLDNEFLSDAAAS